MVNIIKLKILMKSLSTKQHLNKYGVMLATSMKWTTVCRYIDFLNRNGLILKSKYRGYITFYLSSAGKDFYKRIKKLE